MTWEGKSSKGDRETVQTAGQFQSESMSGLSQAWECAGVHDCMSGTWRQ